MDVQGDPTPRLSRPTLGAGYLGFPYFLQRVGHDLAVANLLSYPYTLAAMSVDEDKELSRRLGVDVGRQFNGQLGMLLGGSLRTQATEIRSETDIVAQYEDVFLLAFPNTDTVKFAIPVRRIVDIARSEAKNAVGAPDFVIALTLAAITWEPSYGILNPADFVYRAIEALYQARTDRPNRLFLLRLGMKDESPERLRIRHNLLASRPQAGGKVSGLLTQALEDPSRVHGSRRDGDSDQDAREAEGAKKPRKVPQKGKTKGKPKKNKGFWKFW